MTETANIICRDLTKYYGEHRGIEALDLDVQHGEIFGFLGPNGAGKTTTIRMLMGFIRPTRGTAQVAGMDAWREATRIKLQVGNIPGDVNLYESMRVHELLDYIDRYRPGKDPLREELVERLELDVNKRIKALSRGNRQKVAIVLAVMHDPEILILDEPTLGLDPLMQQEFYNILAELRSRGRTIFLSSHILSEVERACDRVGIVRAGSLVDVRFIEELRASKIRHMDVLFGEPVDASEFLRLEQVLSVDRVDSHLRITIRGEVDPLVKQVAKHPVIDLTFTQPSLEDFFLSFYGAGEGGTVAGRAVEGRPGEAPHNDEPAGGGNEQ